MPPEKPTDPSIECARNGPYLVRNLETGRPILSAELTVVPALVEVVSDPELI